ncbi:MAG TPA: D-amino acid dehydrogenase [Burkholderiaceae bacterium]|nr:D-amino acid dehydrogenase [Burkholderiaceae bacterium]
MTHIVVIGAGITGVTTSYKLLQQGYRVSLLDRQCYPAMDTSFANGGQLSASNAEVWNHPSTIFQGIKWLFRNDAPLLFNLKPSWHKYSWMAEFVWQTRAYRANTIETTRLAIAAREHLFEMAQKENIDFDLEKRGILHVYYSAKEFEQAVKANALLQEAGLERYAVSSEEIRDIEPTLQGRYHAGFYTPSDCTGDIHKFTSGLAQACLAQGLQLICNAEIREIKTENNGVRIYWEDCDARHDGHQSNVVEADAVVICAGSGSRALARQLGDRINIYPVKGYSITVNLNDAESQEAAPWVSLLDESAKIVTSRLGKNRFRVAGTAELNGMNRDIRNDRIQPLINWTRRHFDINTRSVVPWAGLRPMTPNMMPRVGPGSRPRVFYNTGHGHLGWTLSGITAQMACDAITQAVPPR